MTVVGFPAFGSGRAAVGIIAAFLVAACGSGGAPSASPSTPTPSPTASQSPLEAAAPMPQDLVLIGSASGTVSSARALCAPPSGASFLALFLVPIGADKYVLTLSSTHFAGAGVYTDPGQGVGSTAPVPETGTITLGPWSTTSKMQTQRPYNASKFTVDSSLVAGTLDVSLFHPPELGDVGISGSWRCG